MNRFLLNQTKHLALPSLVLLLTVLGLTHIVPVAPPPPDDVSVCGAPFTLPTGSTAWLQDGALHVTLPLGYSYQGKTSAGAPIFAYGAIAEEEEEDVITCACSNNPYHTCEIVASWNSELAEFEFRCTTSNCTSCGFVVKSSKGE